MSTQLHVLTTSCVSLAMHTIVIYTYKAKTYPALRESESWALEKMLAKPESAQMEISNMHYHIAVVNGNLPFYNYSYYWFYVYLQLLMNKGISSWDTIIPPHVDFIIFIHLNLLPVLL